MRQRTINPVLLAATVLLAAAAVPSAAEENDALGDDYVSGDYGRLVFQENGVTIRRASTEPTPSLEQVAGLNAPIFPGDGLATAFDQRAEIQLAGGSLVRVDRASDLTFLALPDPYAEIADNTVLQLENGSIRVLARLSDDAGFRIDTPAASAFVLGDADVRIDVDEDGFTHVASRRGVVEVTAEGGSVLLRAGAETRVYPGDVPENPVAFHTLRGDGFDDWVAARDSAWAEMDRYADNSDAYEALPDEVRPYYRELSASGRWVWVDDFGWSWYPVGVSSDWRPYYDGYWSYGRHGYFWVSHESWGWAPYHYGRWSYVAPYGWCWIPGRVFAGAWVAWSWGSAYVGWSPLGYWNTPYCGTAWAYRYGYYGPSWTFVNYNHIHYRSYRRYAVPYGRLGSGYLNDSAVVTRPPRVSPRDLADSAERRTYAAREARADRAALLRPVSREDRGRATMPDVERRLSSMRATRVQDLRDRDRARSGGTGGRGVGRIEPGAGRRAPDTAVGSTRGGGRPGANARGTTTSLGRNGSVIRQQSTQRTPTPSAGRARGTTAGGRSPARPSEDNRSRAGSRTGTPSRGSGQKVDTPQRRMRDVYEKMSDRRSASPRSRGTSGSAPRERSATGNGGSRGSARPSATPRRSGGSTQRSVAPSRGRSSSPKSASPSRGHSGGSPKASPSRGRSGGSPKASPSRGRSGGSKSSSAGRSRSSGSRGRKGDG